MFGLVCSYIWQVRRRIRTVGWLLRARTILDDNYLIVAAVLILLVGLGGWLTDGTHLSPATTIEERPGALVGNGRAV